MSTVPTEVYEAMQRGAVECAIVGGVWLKSYNLMDVVKTVVDQPLGQYNSSLVLAVGREGWRKLSTAQRQAMIDALPFLVAEATLLNMEETERAFQEAAGMGVRRTPPPAHRGSPLTRCRCTHCGSGACPFGGRFLQRLRHTFSKVSALVYFLYIKSLSKDF